MDPGRELRGWEGDPGWELCVWEWDPGWELCVWEGPGPGAATQPVFSFF